MLISFLPIIHISDKNFFPTPKLRMSSSMQAFIWLHPALNKIEAVLRGAYLCAVVLSCWENTFIFTNFTKDPSHHPFWITIYKILAQGLAPAWHLMSYSPCKAEGMLYVMCKRMEWKMLRHMRQVMCFVFYHSFASNYFVFIYITLLP